MGNLTSRGSGSSSSSSSSGGSGIGPSKPQQPAHPHQHAHHHTSQPSPGSLAAQKHSTVHTARSMTVLPRHQQRPEIYVQVIGDAKPTMRSPTLPVLSPLSPAALTPTPSTSTIPSAHVPPVTYANWVNTSRALAMRDAGEELLAIWSAEHSGGVRSSLVETIVVPQPGFRALHEACFFARLASARLLVEKMNANVNSRTKRGHTPLYIACEKGHIDAVKYLVQECRAEVDTCASDGATPLYIACEKGYFRIVKFLATEARANVNAALSDGVTCLHIATHKGHTEVVKFLIGQMHMDKEVAKLGGVTPLYIACQQGHMSIVRYLVGECGANLATITMTGHSPLHIAVERGHLDVVLYLLDECGADLEAKTIVGWRPLHVAVFYDKYAIVDALLARGARRDVTTTGSTVNVPSGSTPLDIALSKEHVDVINLLTEPPSRIVPSLPIPGLTEDPASPAELVDCNPPPDSDSDCSANE